jgi:hypothetical protein
MGRKIYMYRHMINIAETMLHQAQNNNEYDNSLPTIVFCAFSLEGFLNHVGEYLVEDWKKSPESFKPKEKLLFLADKFSIEIDFGKSPFQSYKVIFEIRNQLAHPKTKEHIKDSKFKLKVNENSKWNADRWECCTNKKEAEKILNDTKQIIDELDKKFPIEKIPSFILSEHI